MSSSSFIFSRMEDTNRLSVSDLSYQVSSRNIKCDMTIKIQTNFTSYNIVLYDRNFYRVSDRVDIEFNFRNFNFRYCSVHGMSELIFFIDFKLISLRHFELKETLQLCQKVRSPPRHSGTPS